MKGKLLLARHHESEWSKLGKWTGARDSHLTPYGFEKAGDMGLLIKDMAIDRAFASMQVRSIETLSCMLSVCDLHTVPTEHAAALNERDYGEHTGKNKWEIKKQMGDEGFHRLRRDWDHPIPGGETLKMVYARAVPFFKDKVLPHVRKGENVLIVAHGNSLRSIVKYVERVSDEDVAELEFAFGVIVIYDLDDDGHMIRKEMRATESPVPA